jgi:hypothetical protein
MLQDVIAVGLAKRQQLSFEELTSLSHGLGGRFITGR